MYCADERLRRNQDEQVLDEPSVVIAGLLFGTLERVGAQIEQLWRAQLDQGLHPDLEAMRRLFHEHGLVLVVAQSGEVAVIGPVEEFVALVGTLAGQQVALVIAVEVHFEGLVAGRVALQQLVP